MATPVVNSTVTLMEGAFQGTVEQYTAQEANAVAGYLGITLDTADVAAFARVDRQFLFGFANLGIAHFQAGSPAPVKK